MVMKTFKGKSQGKQFDHFRFLSHSSKSFFNGVTQQWVGPNKFFFFISQYL